MSGMSIEYIFKTNSIEQVMLFFYDYVTRGISAYGFFLDYKKHWLAHDEDETRFSDHWYIRVEEIDDPIGEITYLSAPAGCYVRFICNKDDNQERFNTFIREVIQKAKLLGFDPILIDDKIPETRDKTRIESRSQKARGNGIIDLTLNKPGRPPDPNYDEAFRRLQFGHDFKEVFEWFCDEQNIQNPDKLLRDSFRSAMKRRQKNT